MSSRLTRRAFFALPIALPVAAVAAKVAPAAPTKAIVEEVHVIPPGGYARVNALLLEARRDRLKAEFIREFVRLQTRLCPIGARDYKSSACIMTGDQIIARAGTAGFGRIMAASRLTPGPYDRVIGIDAGGKDDRFAVAVVRPAQPVAV